MPDAHGQGVDHACPRGHIGGSIPFLPAEM
jgi:hypothetical protein